MDRFVYKEKSVREKGGRSNSSVSIFDNVVSRILLLGISVFLVYNVIHSISITVQKVNVLQRARMEVDNLRLKNLELALLLENIQGTEYLEIQARDRLKFAGKEEYIFVIPEKVLERADSDLEKILELQTEKEEKLSYEVWTDFLFKGI